MWKWKTCQPCWAPPLGFWESSIFLLVFDPPVIPDAKTTLSSRWVNGLLRGNSTIPHAHCSHLNGLPASLWGRIAREALKLFSYLETARHGTKILDQVLFLEGHRSSSHTRTSSATVAGAESCQGTRTTSTNVPCCHWNFLSWQDVI